MVVAKQKLVLIEEPSLRGIPGLYRGRETDCGGASIRLANSHAILLRQKEASLYCESRIDR